MATHFGTWAPSNGFLPIITDTEIQFAAYFVTEPGTYDGVQYALGDWLVYINEKANGEWFKSSGGLVSFSLNQSSMSPVPGTYTKVILSQNGNIVEASTLDASDLPHHKHLLSDLDTTSLSKTVYDTLKSVLANSPSSLVQFAFDDKLGSISADVKVDELSVDKNSDGNLYATGAVTDVDGNEIDIGAGGGTGGTVNIKIANVTGLEKRLTSIEAAIKLNKVLAAPLSAISLVQETGGTFADVRFDGLSIVKNAEGELAVNPDLLSVYPLNGVTVNPDGTTTIGGTCGNFTVEAGEVDGLKDYVYKEIVEYAKLFQINVSDIPIDEDTIIVNADGKLSSVFSKVQPHGHVLEDIAGFPLERIVWASLQKLHQDQDNPIDYSVGKFNITGLTIGEILKKYNVELSTIESELDRVKTMVGKVEPGEPSRVDSVSIVLSSKTVKVFDTVTSLPLDAHYGELTTMVSAKFFPVNEGSLQVLIDENVVAELPLDSSIALGAGRQGLLVEKFEDFYKEIPGFTGTYMGIAVSYRTSDLAEGQHSIKYRHIIGADHWDSRETKFAYAKASAPMVQAVSIETPVLDRYVSGVLAASANGGGKITVNAIKTRTNRYIPLVLGTLSFLDPVTARTINEPLDLALISDEGVVTTVPVSVIFPESFSGTLTVDVEVRDIFGAVTDTRKATSDPVRFDFSTVESLRRVYLVNDPDNYPPNDTESPVLTAFDPSVSLMGSDPKYRMELQVIRDVATFKPGIYSEFDGPDYSLFETSDCEGTQVRWMTLQVPCQKKLFNGYLDLTDGKGNPFPVNLDGSLVGIFLWISPVASSTMVANNWLNANRPYPGFATFTNQDKDFHGLDLARSGRTRRWFTLGRKPEGLKYDSLAIRLALEKGRTLDLNRLVSSLKESIDGQL